MIIKASDIHKSFGQLKVLKGIDLEVRKGEIVSITGASGAGKSTLLKAIAGIMVLWGCERLDPGEAK